MKKNDCPPETTLFPSRCNHFFALKSSKAKGYQPMMLKTIRFRLKSAHRRKKTCKTFCSYIRKLYFCTAFRKEKPSRRLGYGVMVTLQILVLPFLVRVRVPQQKD